MSELKHEKKFDEEKLENILQVTSMLTEKGQRELALDLLVQTIRRLELEAEGQENNEKKHLEELKSKLEDRYSIIEKVKENNFDLYRQFAIKTCIVFAVFLICMLVGAMIMKSLLPDFGNLYKKMAGNEATRIRLIGTLTHNPEVHYKFALLKEKKNTIHDLKEAIEEIELGLGLMINDKELFIKKYEQLINQLSEKDIDKEKYNKRLLNLKKIMNKNNLQN